MVFLKWTFLLLGAFMIGVGAQQIDSCAMQINAMYRCITALKLTDEYRTVAHSKSNILSTTCALDYRKECVAKMTAVDECTAMVVGQSDENNPIWNETLTNINLCYSNYVPNPLDALEELMSQTHLIPDQDASNLINSSPMTFTDDNSDASRLAEIGKECEMTEEQTKCLSDQLNLLNSDTELSTAVTELGKQFGECKRRLSPECAPQSNRQAKCILQAQETMASDVLEQVRLCMSEKGQWSSMSNSTNSTSTESDNSLELTTNVANPAEFVIQTQNVVDMTTKVFGSNEVTNQSAGSETSPGMEVTTASSQSTSDNSQSSEEITGSDSVYASGATAEAMTVVETSSTTSGQLSTGSTSTGSTTFGAPVTKTSTFGTTINGVTSSSSSTTSSPSSIAVSASIGSVSSGSAVPGSTVFDDAVSDSTTLGDTMTGSIVTGSASTGSTAFGGGVSATAVPGSTVTGSDEEISDSTTVSSATSVTATTSLSFDIKDRDLPSSSSSLSSVQSTTTTLTGSGSTTLSSWSANPSSMSGNVGLSSEAPKKLYIRWGDDEIELDPEDMSCLPKQFRQR